MQPGQHSAVTCSPQPARKITERLADVKAFLSRHPEPCQHSKPALEREPQHCRAGSPGPTAERGSPGQPQPRRAGQERCPRQEGLHALQDGPGWGHPSAERVSLHHAGVRGGQGMAFHFYTPLAEQCGFHGKPVQTAFTRWWCRPREAGKPQLGGRMMALVWFLCCFSFSGHRGQRIRIWTKRKDCWAFVL